jgi:hypothetical protein
MGGEFGTQHTGVVLDAGLPHSPSHLQRQHVGGEDVAASIEVVPVIGARGHAEKHRTFVPLDVRADGQ